MKSGFRVQGWPGSSLPIGASPGIAPKYRHRQFCAMGTLSWFSMWVPVLTKNSIQWRVANIRPGEIPRLRQIDAYLSTEAPARVCYGTHNAESNTRTETAGRQENHNSIEKMRVARRLPTTSASL